MGRYWCGAVVSLAGFVSATGTVHANQVDGVDDERLRVLVYVTLVFYATIWLHSVSHFFCLISKIEMNMNEGMMFFDLLYIQQIQLVFLA